MATVAFYFGLGSFIMLFSEPLILSFQGAGEVFLSGVTTLMVLPQVVLTFIFASMALRPILNAEDHVVACPRLNYGLLFAILTIIVISIQAGVHAMMP